MTELEAFRQEKDQAFASDAQSPLTAEQKAAFTGLHYFPENPTLRLELPVEIYAQPEAVEVPASKGDVRHFTRFGRVRFVVEGQPVELTIFSAEGDYFFLPFTDALAGVDTYPAGRYLEPEPLVGGRFRIDFNYAYNPYCAYNDRWSCPLTPAENRLKVAIRAGEKIYTRHD